MKVIAAAGLKCPKEKKAREYITDSEAVDVPETAYYLRLVGDGSLLLAPTNVGASLVGARKKEVKADVQ